MAAQLAARSNKPAGVNLPQPAGEVKSATSTKQTETADRLQQIKLLDAQIAASAKQVTNQNALNISYNKQEALLSVKVQDRQSNDLIRELKFKDYKAMAYSNHGYKGASVDVII
jgi:uncharacterized FlaG/YvyC family protein